MPILEQCYYEALSVSICRSAFRTTGICPLDEEKLVAKAKYVREREKRAKRREKKGEREEHELEQIFQENELEALLLPLVQVRYRTLRVAPWWIFSASFSVTLYPSFLQPSLLSFSLHGHSSAQHI